MRKTTKDKRQEAIDTLKQKCEESELTCDLEFKKCSDCYINSAIEALQEDPRRTGAWNVHLISSGKYGGSEWYGECSECGYDLNVKYNYCPNCGVKIIDTSEIDERQKDGA